MTILAELVEFPAEVDQFHDVAGPERGRIRRGAHQERPNESALAHDVAIEAHHRARIAQAVPFDLATAHVMVGVIAEDIAVFGERDAAAVRDDLQAVFREIQLAIDFRPQQAAYI